MAEVQRNKEKGTEGEGESKRERRAPPLLPKCLHPHELLNLRVFTSHKGNLRVTHKDKVEETLERKKWESKGEGTFHFISFQN